MAVNKNFIVKNGIEVKNNLIYADTDLNSVGIGTTIVNHKFHVIGGIGATTTVISGISTVGSLSVGSNEVISSARQLKNIASLDSTTTAAIEAAIVTGPNTFDDLQVTGVSTFKADVIAEDNLLVSGVSTFTGTIDANGTLDVAGNAGIGSLNVIGVSTFTGDINANGNIDLPNTSAIKIGDSDDLWLWHDATNHSFIRNATGDLRLQSDSITLKNYEGTHNYLTGTESGSVDIYHNNAKKINTTSTGAEVTGVLTATTFSGDLTGTVNTAAQPNITSLGTIAQLEATNANVTGVGTVAQFNATNSVLGVATATSFVGDLTGTVQTAAQPNITSLGTIANLSATNANITGVGTVAQFNATNASIGVVTFTTATIGNLVGSPLSGVSTEFTGQIGIQSGGVRIGVGVTQLNFVGSGNTFQYNPSTDTVDITISGGGGGGSGASVSIGQTAPVNPSSGDLWFNIDIARTFVYYNEAALGVGSSSFWVDASPFEASGMFLSKMGDNMLAGLGITAGTISAPGLYFNGDTNTGLYSPAADQFAFTAGGVGIATFQTGILEAGGARFSAGGVSAGVVTTTNLFANGRVGISTGSIDPSGNQLLIRGATTVGTNKGHIMLTGDGATNGEGPQIVFSESGSGSAYAGAYVGHAREGSNSVGTLVFGTRATGGDASTVPTERLRIGSAGQFGLSGANYGTDGQVLTSKGSGAAVQWATPAAGWAKLGSGSATSGSTSVVTTSQLTSSYDFYKIVFRVKLNTAGKFGINLSTNGGTSYTTADGSWKTSVQGREGGAHWNIGEACDWGQLLAGNNKEYYAGEIKFNHPTGTTLFPNFNSDFGFAQDEAGNGGYYGAAVSTTVFDTVAAYNAIRLETNQTIVDLKWSFLAMAV